MTKRSTLLQTCSALVGNRQGNFGLMAALLLPVLLASGGVAIDVTNMMMAKNHLQDATDSAALAASSALANEAATQAQAKLMATEFVKTQMRNWKSSGMSPEEQAAFNEAFARGTSVDIVEQKAALGNAKTYDITVTSTFTLSLNGMTRLLGRDSVEIATISKSFGSSEAKNALSMYLVLDQSGSMGEMTNTVDPANPTRKCGSKTCPNYLTKIASLKLATASLLTQLKTADPSTSLVRTGAVSYSTSMLPPVNTDWGVTKVMTYVNALPASGSTDSSDAIETAYQALKDSGETKWHASKNGQVPKRFIVFMTDGDNNVYQNKSSSTGADKATKKTCVEAKKNGIEVYTIAFMAPSRGQGLLKSCATTGNHYFSAEDADELTAAFKYIGEKAANMTVRLTH